MEIWRSTEIDGYEVSSIGRVRSIDRNKRDKNGVLKRFRGRFLTPGLSGQKRNYLFVMLGSGNPRSVHVLVCTAFHGPRPDKNYDAAHFDGNSLNNHSYNLRWATHTENCADMLRHGTRLYGSKHGRAKLTDADRSEILLRNDHPAQIADDFDVHWTTVYRIKRESNGSSPC